MNFNKAHLSTLNFISRVLAQSDTLTRSFYQVIAITVCKVIFKGLIIFCGRQVCKDFCGLILLVIKLNTLFL